MHIIDLGDKRYDNYENGYFRFTAKPQFPIGMLGQCHSIFIFCNVLPCNFSKTSEYD